MIYGLQEANALARICYHAQELSLLTANHWVVPAEIAEVKAALDLAYNELTNPRKDYNDVN